MLKFKDVKPGDILYNEIMYGKTRHLLVLSKPVKMSGRGRYRMNIMWLSKTSWGNVVERYIAFEDIDWNKLC